MRNRITFVSVIVGLLLSALPASAQRGRSNTGQFAPRQQTVARPQGGARLPVVREDYSWRRAGVGTFGWGGGYGGYRGMSWRAFGQQALGAAIVGTAFGLAARQQNEIVVVQQPVTYVNPATGQPIPAVYQPPVQQPQPVQQYAPVPVQKVGPPTPDDYKTDGNQNALSRCVFNGGDTVRSGFSYPIIVRQVTKDGGVQDRTTLLGGQSTCLPQVPIDGSWWYEGVARVNVNGGVSAEGEDLRTHGGVELGRLFAQGFPGGWLFAPPPASERQ